MGVIGIVVIVGSYGWDGVIRSSLCRSPSPAATTKQYRPARLHVSLALRSSSVVSSSVLHSRNVDKGSPRRTRNSESSPSRRSKHSAFSEDSLSFSPKLDFRTNTYDSDKAFVPPSAACTAWSAGLETSLALLPSALSLTSSHHLENSAAQISKSRGATDGCPDAT